MTDTNPPADRTTEIRARLMAATMPNPEQEFEKFGKAVTASFVLREHAARDIAFLLYELDRKSARVEELEGQLAKGEEEWAVRVFTRADQTHWFHQDARAETFEADLAMTIKVAADGTVMGAGEAPVSHGFAVVKRTVWSSEWETVKTVEATGKPVTAPGVRACDHRQCPPSECRGC